MAQPSVLDQIRAQTARVNLAAQNNVEVQAAVAKRGQELVDAISTNSMAAGTAQGTVLRTQQAAALEAQLATQRAAKAVGGIDRVIDQIVEVDMQAERVQSALKEAETLGKVTIWDGPIDYFSARRGAIKAEATAEAALAQGNAAAARAKQLVAGVDAVAQLAAATKTNITVGSIEASTIALQAEWNSKAASAQLEGLKYAALPVRAILEAEDAKLAGLNNLQAHNERERNYAMQLRQDRRAEAQLQLMRDREVVDKGDRTLQQQLAARDLYYTNLARAARNEAPLAGLDWEAYRKRAKETNDPEYFKLIDLGRLSEAGTPVVATSPSGVAELIARNPNFRLVDTRDKPVKLVRQAMQELGQMQSSPGSLQERQLVEDMAKDKTGSKQRAFIDQRVNDLVRAQATLVTQDPNNMFNFGTLNTFLTESPFQQYPLNYRVLTPAIKAGISFDSPDKVMKLTLEGIETKQITTAQAAADFSNMYRRAAMAHRESLGLKGMGVSMEGISGHVMQIGDRQVDTTNYMEVLQAMNAELRQRLFKGEALGRGTPVFERLFSGGEVRP